jgi:hypothetical protein
MDSAYRNGSGFLRPFDFVLGIGEFHSEGRQTAGGRPMTAPCHRWSYSPRTLIVVTSAIGCLVAFALVRRPTSLQMIGAGLAVAALVAPCTLFLVSATPRWRNSKASSNTQADGP